ncbi:uncharacterized protein LOC111705589 [Eurytemora carolleeae]|uniref:uncharacterized protein LOC111705589 n=1 Tax=Eurytemora carolleeae TaxID=1294199 RepID=UPI000C776490|nr:uncharacterized protein LOC111705589 [Eurytemora carolleeae]|eukprot:XP_023333949.1 uncharacterized protein LOC111705589 [Eurytemora affinis]
MCSRPSRPRPVSDTQAPQQVNLGNLLPSTLPRKLEPLDRKPDVPDVRIKIPEQKGLGGLHLSVNYKKVSWKPNAMDPLIQGKSDESEHSENEDELNQTYNR